MTLRTRIASIWGFLLLAVLLVVGTDALSQSRALAAGSSGEILDQRDGALQIVSVYADSTTFSIPLIIVDGPKVDTLHFGLQPTATFCRDVALGELEMPPVPPNGVFDTRFIDPRRDGDFECFSHGVTLDFRPPLNPAQIDTYRVKFQPGPAGYPLTFSWPPLGPYYDGAVTLHDGLTGTIVSVNMKTQNSYVLTQPIVHELFIVAGGTTDSIFIPPAMHPPIPLYIVDGLQADTLRFGLQPTATFCRDSALGELERPPVPPLGVFDSRFIDPRQTGDECFGRGLHLDLRPLLNTAQIDTYLVHFQPGAAGYPLTFSWPPLGPYYDGPVTLFDAITGGIVRVNMKTQNSYVLTQSNIHDLYIAAGGPADSIFIPDSTAFRTFSQTDYAMRAHRLRVGMLPTAANVRDETFKETGWFNAGLSIGIPRPDSTLAYGWIFFRRNVVRLPRFLPHTGTPRGFDFYIPGKPWHDSRVNPAVKYHDNHLAGEQFSLRFNIGASDVGITPAGFGELIFFDPSAPLNPFNGMTVRQLAAHTDTALTYYKQYNANYFLQLDSCLSRINNAFTGPIDIYTISPLSVAGARSLSDVPFLHSNPSPHPLPPPRAGKAPDLGLPTEYALYQNYPNPFNPVTVIEFDLPSASGVTLRVFSSLGQEVARVLDAVHLDEGRQSFEFDGNALPSGVYFYRLEIISRDASAGYPMQIRKMLLMK